MNFNSTGNNFGSGSISFKSHQEQNFVVLNAKFTYNPESPEYQAADVLEIYVPDLSIERSAIAGVFMRFRDVHNSYGYTWDNSGGTVLKSWVKDKNTLCIEKLTNFDDKGEITIYVLTLYTMLARGGNPIKGTRVRLETTTEDNYLYWIGHLLCPVRALGVPPHAVFQLHLCPPRFALGVQSG